MRPAKAERTAACIPQRPRGAQPVLVMSVETPIRWLPFEAQPACTSARLVHGFRERVKAHGEQSWQEARVRKGRAHRLLVCTGCGDETGSGGSCRNLTGCSSPDVMSVSSTNVCPTVVMAVLVDMLRAVAENLLANGSSASQIFRIFPREVCANFISELDVGRARPATIWPHDHGVEVGLRLGLRAILSTKDERVGKRALRTAALEVCPANVWWRLGLF